MLKRAKVDWSKGSPEPIRALNRMPENENNEPLVDLRVVAPEVRVGRLTTIPFVRQTVAEMTHKAALSLPKGIVLVVSDAWRPKERQQRIYDWFWKCAKEAHPERDYSALRRTVNRFVAPPDHKAPPGHCTGAAIDCWLESEEGEALDLVSPFTRFTASSTYCLGLTAEASQNRLMLVTAMLNAGFSNCRDEYWHYSYGDAGWAVRTGSGSCVYGLISMDPAIYVAQERAFAQAISERPNPFFHAD